MRCIDAPAGAYEYDEYIDIVILGMSASVRVHWTQHTPVGRGVTDASPYCVFRCVDPAWAQRDLSLADGRRHPAASAQNAKSDACRRRGASAASGVRTPASSHGTAPTSRRHRSAGRSSAVAGQRRRTGHECSSAGHGTGRRPPARRTSAAPRSMRGRCRGRPKRWRSCPA